MKRSTTITELFASDDEQAGITIEYEDMTVTSLVLSLKNGPKVLLTPQQLDQVAELVPIAAEFVKHKTMPLATDEAPTA